jgi:hypothetical protein
VWKISVIVPKLVKVWLNGLWSSLPTAPQPTKNKRNILYAIEAAFARSRADEISKAEKMLHARV